MKYIVAGTYGEYQDYILRNNLNRLDYPYVTDIHALRGLSSIDGFYIGTYYNRPDLLEIQQQIAIIKAHMNMPKHATVIHTKNGAKNNNVAIGTKVHMNSKTLQFTGDKWIEVDV